MLDKAIAHGKEHRKQYRKSKRFDRSCRNHGSCPRCEADRLANDTARRRAATQQIIEFVTAPADNHSVERATAPSQETE